MQEFSSVTASSYDADSLTPLLNDKATEGWSVVSIVTAGTSIVAYLQRESDGTPDMSGDDTAIADMTVADEPADAPFVPVAAAPQTPDPVDEPAGWATAPTDSPAAADASADAPVAQVSEPVAVAPVAAAPVATTPPAAEAAPAAADAVPAGWYADPSGRFELRYWDGAAWTEHVSRAGQQFTDPPVA